MKPSVALVFLALALTACRKPAAAPPVAQFPRAGAPWTNSLGMRFVPAGAPNVLFSVFETRAADFELFVKETHTPWIPPDAETGGEYPAANVTWVDAVAFCEWLTSKERLAKLIGPTQRYRLPSDDEWSDAAGVKAGDAVQYAWGANWPPPRDAGNFAGEEAPVDQSEPNNFIAGYRDPYPRLAPVGKFTPNAFGLYDVAGNVLEWCEDEADDPTHGRIARGGSWLNGDPESLSLKHRAVLPARAGLDVIGFRCVLDVGR